MAESGEFEKRIREERIRYEQAKHLHEEQRRFEQQKESDSDRILREELRRRSEEMKRRLEELKAAELRRQSALEERQREEEERLRKIAEKNEEEKFAEFTSTDLPIVEPVTKKIRYRLRPSQCAAINKFTRVFKITDPSSWIAKNCQFAKRYFPQASCPQIQSLIESCFAFL
ncbi:hypothetical protein ANCCAN_07842 [Ancylostoma caninum]|uniref:aECM cysteine-cradle domain-containing protein n=1 Tax=Ancylostoma caninum TaxID=29170 RepID=A0A368GP82_ANCCA|nr:hypothetical protein ANCCAN_07842 [Ancylostoma caninum]